MAIFKCKMCGGDLEVAEGANITECEYCGTKQTVPTADNEKKVNLFNRANRLRIGGEFDKAAAIYESIVAEFPEEAEAYWGLCLCHYGIEYVDDPATAKKIPTCHRASFESLQKDENFSLALEYADVVAQKVYRDEAREIDRIMSEILAVSKSEKPYDVFICYKETDEKGERTIDSVLAQDIYDVLTAKGLKVFFARITLEDKLGKQYEPYIFAALNSAKVMLAIGTKYEYYHAVWVKNEWSRFLKLMAKDKTKTLIPCFKDLDAYDMPEEFKMLQAQNMGKIGAIQDLVRGVEKLTERNKYANEADSRQTPVGPNVAALLRRGNIALEYGEWNKAKEHFEQVLNTSAECAEAYLGLALAEEELKSAKALIEKGKTGNKNYQRAKQFANETLLGNLTTIEKQVKEKKLEDEAQRKKQRQEHLLFLTERIEQAKKAQGLIAAAYWYRLIVGLKNDGTVVFNDSKAMKQYCWTDIVAVAAGRSHVFGLKSDGTVVASKMGIRDRQYDYGAGDVSEWTDIVAISGGFAHTVGLRSNGTVVATKIKRDETHKEGQCDVQSWTDIVAVSAGWSHTVGLKSDGTVVSTKYTGTSSFWNCGQCEVSGWTDIIAIAAGDFHTVGLKSNGTVIATKFTNSEHRHSGQCNVYGWSDIIAIAAGGDHTVGLKSNGRVVAVGSNECGQCNVYGWTDIVAVSAGGEYTVGLKSDGTVVAVGEDIDASSNVSDWKLFDSLNDFENERTQKMAELVQKGLEQRKHIAERREKGLCQHCGGTLKGLIKKTCTVCGKEKDY